MRIILRSSCCG